MYTTPSFPRSISLEVTNPVSRRRTAPLPSRFVEPLRAATSIPRTYRNDGFSVQSLEVLSVIPKYSVPRRPRPIRWVILSDAHVVRPPGPGNAAAASLGRTMLKPLTVSSPGHTKRQLRLKGSFSLFFLYFVDLFIVVFIATDTHVCATVRAQ